MGLGDYMNAVRRNHALEHATIAVLLSRIPAGIRLVSRATKDGFYVFGDVPRAELELSAREALIRLQQGEAHLAVSPLCGTNIAVTGILTGLVSAALVNRRRRIQSIPNVLTGAVLAVVAAQPLGRLVQQHLTTDAQLSGYEIVGLSEGGWGPGRFIKVETAHS